MELIMPGSGLVIWQILIFTNIILFVVSWLMILTTKALDSRARLSWLLGTLFLPILGPLLFLVKYVRMKRIR
jgi:hypothetical protein